MRDFVIRQAFHKSVLKPAHEDAATFVVDELGLKNGEIRADIAVLNGKLVGYEIKTENDTLTRLPAQVTAYNEVFDKAYIIISKNHLEKALETIPEWWGIYMIKVNSDSQYFFSCVRNAKINRQIKSFSLSQLLWKAEALEVANKLLHHNIKPTTSKHEVYDIISGTCSSKKLSKIVIHYLKQREHWRKDRIQLL
ncbi:MAG: sce7726 family protein [Chitinophagaceae bacterium]|nr:sce7726 family protein [Chitinophagaceae bacterium]